MSEHPATGGGKHTDSPGREPPPDDNSWLEVETIRGLNPTGLTAPQDCERQADGE